MNGRLGRKYCYRKRQSVAAELASIDARKNSTGWFHSPYKWQHRRYDWQKMASSGSNVFLVNLASKLGTEWSTLGLHLGLDWSRVNLLRAQHSHNLLEAIQAMLNEWWAGAGNKSTEEKKKRLISALRECGRVDLAEDIRKGRIAVPAQTARERSSSSDDSLDFPVQDSADGCRLPAGATANLTAGIQTLTIQPSDREPSPSQPPAYPIRSKVGHALIINNIKFPTMRGRNRKGMEKDSTDLEVVLHRLGFSVKVKIDLSSYEMKDAIRKFINKNHSQSTCLLLSIMTHGKEQEAMGTDWKGVGIHKDIILPIVKSDNIPCPKVFIMQMCRGNDRDVGVSRVRWGVDDAAAVDAQPMEVTEDSDSDSSSDEEPSPELEAFEVDWSGVCSKLAPTDVDYIVTWACAEGKVSLRSRKQGSVLIQEVVKAFDKYGRDEDVATLFERVRRNVAKVEANLREEDRKTESIVKQSAETKTHLLGKLYFKSSSSSA
ncbi:caspase-12-like isoform X2 [Branchiostoma lanceolatum]|uniref:caspase-12-like isoform X2 n=1 Tax=Branchiostoma lanceolatum TaxID=7740 RepID=UPI0034550B8A